MHRAAFVRIPSSNRLLLEGKDFKEKNEIMDKTVSRVDRK